MRRVIIPVLSLITIVICVLNFVLYDVSEKATVFCGKDSYAYEWAKEHNVPVEVISDSDEHIFSSNLEHFSYKFIENLAIITEYNGDSEAIAIPYFIEGKMVYRVEKEAFDNADNLKKIYVPNTVLEFEATELEDITVYCKEGSATWDKLDENQKKELLDSDYVDFSNAEIPFSYDIENGKINLNRCYVDTEYVLVPSHVDGKEVKEISFPVLEAGIKVVIIPDTVTEINSDIYTSRYDARFFLGTGILVLGCLVAVSASLIAFKKDDAHSKKFLGVPFVLSGRKYYILFTIVGVLTIWFPLIIWIYVILAFIILAFAVSEIISVYVARENIQKTEEKVKAKTAFIKLLTADAQTLISVAKNDEAKQVAKKVYEAIRYSDPMSAEGLLNVEEKISSTFEDFSNSISNNSENLNALAEQLLVLIKERNNRCKVLK